MTQAFIAAPPVVTPPPGYVPARRLTLESIDGQRRIPLDGSSGWWRMDGATGLEMPPSEVVRGMAPGVAGSVVQDVRTAERPIFVPLAVVSSGGPVGVADMVESLRALVDPRDGAFRLVASSPLGEREIDCYYLEGLEGGGGRSETGIYWRKLGLSAVAAQPFARARADRVVEFAQAPTSSLFMGVEGGTDAPWPVALASSAVIGSQMRVVVGGEAPVYPTLRLTGPMSSFTGTMTSTDAGMGGWSVSVPNGVAAGKTLTLVTDPRSRSIRLDGALAAGSVSRGSTLRPFYPGENVLDVAAPGGGDTTRVAVSWRNLYRSLW